MQVTLVGQGRVAHDQVLGRDLTCFVHERVVGVEAPQGRPKGAGSLPRPINDRHTRPWRKGKAGCTRIPSGVR